MRVNPISTEEYFLHIYNQNSIDKNPPEKTPKESSDNDLPGKGITELEDTFERVNEPVKDTQESEEGKYQEEDKVSEKESKKANGDRELTEEEKREVEELKKTDQKVRRHEQAHIAAGGQYVRGGARYEYDTGPDKKRYAVGGEVTIDTSEEQTPEATIVKAQVVRRAALAPSDPSPQDRQVASEASRVESEARAELAQERREEGTEKVEQKDSRQIEEQPGLEKNDIPQASTSTMDDAVKTYKKHKELGESGGGFFNRVG